MAAVEVWGSPTVTRAEFQTLSLPLYLQAIGLGRRLLMTTITCCPYAHNYYNNGQV